MAQTKVAVLTEEIVEGLANTKTTHIKTPEDLVYEKRISYLVKLLSPMVLIQGSTEIVPLNLITEEIYRDQVQDWIMILTKKHLDL